MAIDTNVEPLAVKPGTVARLLDIGITSVYELIKSGELRTVRLGSDQRVMMEDVRRIASYGCLLPKRQK